MVLAELLVGLSVIAALLGAALPAGHALYARAAVTYEAVRLVGELRRMQAVSRMTAVQFYMLEQERAGTRAPSLYFYADGYEIRRPLTGAVRTHRVLPLVRIERPNLANRPASFDGNGNIAWAKSANMTIGIYVKGRESDALRVVIDSAARIRLERGV